MAQADSKLQSELLDLLDQSKVLSLASLNMSNEPEASLSPFLFHDKALWIYVSRLSAHTHNLEHHPKASVLLAAEQQDNPFAIKRLSLQCDVIKTLDNKQQILDKMALKFGDIIAVLRSLPDFYLFALKPITGRYIKGFGQAYDVGWPDLTFNHSKP